MPLTTGALANHPVWHGLNAPSRAAALRLGFRIEGVSRQVVVYKV